MDVSFSFIVVFADRFVYVLDFIAFLVLICTIFLGDDNLSVWQGASLDQTHPHSRSVCWTAADSAFVCLFVCL